MTTITEGQRQKFIRLVTVIRTGLKATYGPQKGSCAFCKVSPHKNLDHEVHEELLHKPSSRDFAGSLSFPVLYFSSVKKKSTEKTSLNKFSKKKKQETFKNDCCPKGQNSGRSSSGSFPPRKNLRSDSRWMRGALRRLRVKICSVQ